MAPEDRTVEKVIARIASAAHGVVSRREMRDAGVSADEIKRRVANGALIRVYRGVYRVGHTAPSTEAAYRAATKAGGRGALLCGRAAAYLLGILKSPFPPAPEVLTPTERRVPGLTAHRSKRLDPRDATTVRGVPVTSVPRTIVDLAAELTDDELARVCHEAGVRYRTTPKQVEVVLARRPTAPGAAKVRRVMRGDVKVALSKLERRFLQLLEAAGLPLPVTNRPAGGRRVDCRWPGHGLTVELDSYRFHNSRHAWEQDRRREREARARGDDFRRYGYADVFEDPRWMLAELRELLA